MKANTIHAMFRCVDCGREWGKYTTAEDLARRHARETGHEVRGEIGIAVTIPRAAS